METNQVNRSTIKTKAGLEKAIDLLTNGNSAITLLEDAIMYYSNGKLSNSAYIHLGKGTGDPFPLQVDYNANKGSGNAICMSDHVHPNTCPVPQAYNQIANKEYVDNRISVSYSLFGVNAGTVHTQTLVINTLTQLSYHSLLLANGISQVGTGNQWMQHVIDKTGLYEVSFSGLCTFSVDNPLIKATVYKGYDSDINDETYLGSGIILGVSNAVGSYCSSGLLLLNEGDHIGIKVLSDKAGVITHTKMSFSVKRIVTA